MKAFAFGNRQHCAYCGDPADSRDHVIAVSYNRDVWKRGKRHGVDPDLGPVTWACRDCNSRIYNRWFESFDARCRWIRDALNKEAKEILWTKSEIEKLDYTLRTYVQNRVDVLKWFRLRADWYESADYIRNVDSLEWQSSADEDSIRYFAPTVTLIRIHYARWGCLCS